MLQKSTHQLFPSRKGEKKHSRGGNGVTELKGGQLENCSKNKCCLNLSQVISARETVEVSWKPLKRKETKLYFLFFVFVVDWIAPGPRYRDLLQQQERAVLAGGRAEELEGQLAAARGEKEVYTKELTIAKEKVDNTLMYTEVNLSLFDGAKFLCFYKK